MHREISIPGFTNRVKLNEIAVATRQLATMIDSGLSVVRALGILAGQVENKELGRVLGEVRMEVERGSSLSAACAKHPKIFNTLFVTMVQAGEAGGHLDEVLLDLASTIEKQAVLRRKIRSAMTYPAIVLSVMVVIFLALLIFIVPVFQKLFASLHAKLPAPTLIVIGISKIVLSVWAVLARRHPGRRDRAAPAVDQDRGRTPEVGRLQAQATHLRTARAQGVDGPPVAHPGVVDPGRRADPGVARHRVRDRRQPGHRKRPARRQGRGA